MFFEEEKSRRDQHQESITKKKVQLVVIPDEHRWIDTIDVECGNYGGKIWNSSSFCIWVRGKLVINKNSNFQADQQDQPNWGQSLGNLCKWMGPMWYGYELSTPTQSNMKTVNIVGIGLINPTHRDYI